MKQISHDTLMIELNPLSKAIAQIIARMKVASMMMQAQRRVAQPVVSIDDERGWLEEETPEPSAEAFERLAAKTKVPAVSYEVWQEPTELGADLFPRKLLGTFADRDAAYEFAYLENAEEPAPDKHEYRRIVVREVVA